ncbi:hypothetical protein CVS54_01500 [Microbacterium oxydans]|uniref:CU044_5270 family protein n=1 Tax=Microbacterium oxydans TaxID=82380 RepID=A0A3Q9J4I1_9MICO|nr:MULTISPECIES: hypothetical protein [unclassified Microbacterium]AZS40176.1 hypothetical protein CVS54_01500 [Microbacterium oxydans]KKX96847.1 hypothetical protein AAY78_16245 [Microbacterium sp. Ag1]
MDVFEKVEQTRPEIEGEEENLAAARAVLLTEIREERRPAGPRSARRPWFIAAGALGAAAAITVGVLVVNSGTAPSRIVEAVPTAEPRVTDVPSPAPTLTPATAPEILQGAANAAAEFAPPALGPGQYLRHGWTEEHLVTFDRTLADQGFSPGDLGTRATATSGWVIERSGADYSPADLRSQWYRETGPYQVTRIFGDEELARTYSDRFLQYSGQGQRLSPEVPWLPESAAENMLWYFDTMPRDPHAMLAWIRDYQGPDREGWEDGKVGWMLIGLLSFNVGDPEMRAAMYRALSLLPGSTVGPEQEGQRTITFDSQLATPEGDGTSLTRYTVTIEVGTGLVTETTETSDVGLGIMPSDVPDTRVRYEMSIVDALPW